MEESEVPLDSNDVEQQFAFLIDVYPNQRRYNLGHCNQNQLFTSESVDFFYPSFRTLNQYIHSRQSQQSLTSLKQPMDLFFTSQIQRHSYQCLFTGFIQILTAIQLSSYCVGFSSSYPINLNSSVAIPFPKVQSAFVHSQLVVIWLVQRNIMFWYVAYLREFGCQDAKQVMVILVLWQRCSGLGF